MSDNEKKSGILQSKKVLILLAIIYYLYAMSNIDGSYVFVSLVSLFTIIVMLIESSEFDFYLFIGLSGFEYSIKILNKNIIFLLFLVAIFKLVLGKKWRISKYTFIGLLLLISFQIMNDLFKIPILNFINTFSTIIYFIVFISAVTNLNIRINICLFSFVVSYFFIILSTILTYPTLLIFLNSLSNESLSRFGNTSKYITGGAMGIPLYSALVISLLISYWIIKNKKMLLSQKFIFVLICIIALFFGLLTISRSFFLCLFVIFFYLFINTIVTGSKSSIKVLCFIVFLTIVLVSFNFKWIEQLLNKYVTRNNIDYGLGIRGLIYIDSLNYLLTNPFRMIFGTGIWNYSQVGMNSGNYFSYTAHNLFLDVVMGTGLLGLSIFIMLLNKYKNVLENKFVRKKCFIGFMPFIIFLTFSLTAVSLIEVKTYIYMLLLIYYGNVVCTNDY